MKLKTLAIVLALASTSSAFASSYYGSSSQIGNTTYHSGSYGSGMSTQIGNTTYHSGSFGSGTSTSIGNTTYHNFYSD